MRIINISYTDQGGAGIAVSRTHQRLKELGYDSYLFLADDIKEAEKNTVEGIQGGKKIVNLFKRIVKAFTSRILQYAYRVGVKKKQQVPDRYCFFSKSELNKISIQKILENVADGDIVILYWLGLGLMNSANIVELANKAKIRLYWYALDMAAVTGGCHYFWECTGYLNDCSNCPALEPGNKQFANKQFTVKKKNLDKISITLLASSDIGVNAFEKAAIKFSSYHKLPYAINTDAFDVGAANPDLAAVNYKIFFNAQNKYDIRKGWEYFKTMIVLLDMVLDRNENNRIVDLISVDIENHGQHFKELKHIRICDAGGHKNSDSELATLYQQSDLFICTSVEDLSPLMVNESLLCGVPVIAFDNASNREYIIDNENGILVKIFDTHKMAEVVGEIILGKIKFNSSEKIRESVIELHRTEDWHRTFKKLISN